MINQSTPANQNNLLLSRQRVVGKLPDDVRQRLIRGRKRSNKPIYFIFGFIVFVFFILITYFVLIGTDLATIMVGVLCFALFGLFYLAYASSTKQRMQLLKKGDLDVYEMTGTLTTQQIVVPSRSGPVVSYALFIDGIQLPAIVEEENVHLLPTFLPYCNPNHVTVQYQPDVFLNISMSDDQGHRVDFL